MIFRSATRLFAAMLLCSAVARAQPADTTAMRSLATDNAAFALDLYSQLRTTDGNLFFSPYSISTCLAMTYAGARSDTARQIARTFHFNADPVALAAPFAALQKELNAAPEKTGIELHLANGLWADASHRFQPAFLDIATKQYAAKLEQVDFLTQAETARVAINNWVSQQTQNKITDLFPARALNAQTRLALVNAIYFKGRWANPFQTNRTTSAPFAVTPDEKVQAPLMHLEASFNYAETPDLQLLEMPYGGGSSASSAHLSMVVLLPKDPIAFQSFEIALNSSKLETSLAAAQRKEVSVFLPKFKMTQQFDLSDTLSMMGMLNAFSPHADFSGMDGDFNLSISTVVHKAFVEVNEEGTEAAAATGVAMAATALAPRSKPTFRADHPFIFLIRDTGSGSILFLGRLNDPTK